VAFRFQRLRPFPELGLWADCRWRLAYTQIRLVKKPWAGQIDRFRDFVH
jgi:hypothetical protein